MLTLQNDDVFVTAYPGYTSSLKEFTSTNRNFPNVNSELADVADSDDLESSSQIREATTETISYDKSSVNSVMPLAAKSMSENPVEISERYTRMSALLLRPESIQFLHLLIADSIEPRQKNVVLCNFISESPVNLQTFAELVTENLISVDDDRTIVVTDLCERVVNQLAGDASDSK